MPLTSVCGGHYPTRVSCGHLLLATRLDRIPSKALGLWGGCREASERLDEGSSGFFKVERWEPRVEKASGHPAGGRGPWCCRSPARLLGVWPCGSDRHFLTGDTGLAIPTHQVSSSGASHPQLRNPPRCVTFGKLLHLSVPGFPCLY